jgi:hypothetical protein
MGLTSCRWITIAGTIARRRRGAQPTSCRWPANGPAWCRWVLDPPTTVGPIGPRWTDVSGFDVRDHLHRCTLPAPGGDAELHAHASRRAAYTLDGRRPLWEADLIDGYQGGSAG